MKLFRLLMVAGLSFMMPGKTTMLAQSVVPPTQQTGIHLYASVAAGLAPFQSERLPNGGMHTEFDVSAGVRKHIRGVLGFVVSANAGRMMDNVVGSEDAICRIRFDGKAGCYPNTPAVNWFGASAGAEADFGRAIIALQFGPTSVGAPAYERQLVAGSPAREWGLRSQFSTILPVTSQLGLTFSAADHYVPSILDDRWHITTLNVGLTLRKFHAAR